MQLENKIRQLARSSYWQNIYKNSKDCNNINLFENDYRFSGIQSEFLYWVSLYSMLYEELGKHESSLLTQNVIEDNDRCDAYLYYRSNKIDKEWQKHQQEKNQEKIDSNRKKKFSEGNRTDINVQFRRK